MNIIETITTKDDKEAYEEVNKILSISKESDEYYQYLSEFAKLLDDEKSYVRTRAFLLICAQAKWDKEEKIKTILFEMLILFHDEKPTVVRQCLKAIKEVLVYLPDSKKMIVDEIEKIDLRIYKDSMAPLIKKDIEDLMKNI